jgi:hypothetical protein
VSGILPHGLQNARFNSHCSDTRSLERSHDPGSGSSPEFCSLYVQLSRLQSSKGLKLLQKLDMGDIQFGPYPRLAELEKLREFEKETIATWLDNDDLMGI